MPLHPPTIGHATDYATEHANAPLTSPATAPINAPTTAPADENAASAALHRSLVVTQDLFDQFRKILGKK